MITPRKTSAKADAFIAGAPDAGNQAVPATPKTVRTVGKKSIITVSINPEVLATAALVNRDGELG
jgi:hypothetical protein